MRTRTTLTAAALVAAGAMLGWLAASARPTMALAQEKPNPDRPPTGKALADARERQAPEKEQARQERREEFIAAFNRGDAKALAGFWTPDATYVDQVGGEHKGREAIEQLYEKEFAARKGAKLTIHVASRKQVLPDVVLEDGITEVTPADGGPGTVARFDAVLVKKDGTWYLQSVHDAVALPPSHAAHLEDLEWLIGEWTGEAEKGESAQASYDWEEDQNFIVSTFAITLDGFPVVGGTQWIGWDTIDKQVRSWSFYSRGGFGEATWTRDGNTWALKTTAQTGDGKKVSATNIITKLDDDHLTWQMTKLTVDGESQPDPKPVKMKRVPPAQP
jgi:uncharacterized protein (TIGR02246 family)